MRKILRYLLVAFSIAALTNTIANAKQLVDVTEIKNPSKRPMVVNPNEITPEWISKSYVTIAPELEKNSLPDLLQTIDRLIKPVANKMYSLLQWKSEQRRYDLEVTSYNRVGHFGKWAQDRQDKTCYNTRAKVLIRDSATPVLFSPENACSVDKGHWVDPYGGRILTDAKAEIQIDHMIPLKNAYISGAYRWDFKARCLYGNYLGVNYHLISVDGNENQRKGDKAPDLYMPLKKEYSCTYLKHWLSVKTLWGLEMTVNEARAIKQLVQAEKCDPKEFVITDEELQAQRKFAAANAELCAEFPYDKK